jgi:hypothetical protein
MITAREIVQGRDDTVEYILQILEKQNRLIKFKAVSS